MVLWTIVPEEAIFAESIQPVVYEEMQYLGQKVMVEKISPNQFRVVRLLTTAPADYLRNDLQPGTVIIWKPALEALS
ncbi:MAG: YlzJ-like protein [Firmicutes bacterium]|nr:YlzJ-like protein [Bacillota bacterium]